MTDPIEERPVDLRALLLDDQEEARLLREVMSRVQQGEVVSLPRRTMLVVGTAAALAATLAGIAVLRGPEPVATSPLVSWLEEGRVPTNAELLLAFGGYQP